MNLTNFDVNSLKICKIGLFRGKKYIIYFIIFQIKVYFTFCLNSLHHKFIEFAISFDGKLPIICKQCGTIRHVSAGQYH